VRVERTFDRQTCRTPVLKTGRITGPHALPEYKKVEERMRVRSALIVASAVAWHKPMLFPAEKGLLQFREGSSEI